MQVDLAELSPAARRVFDPGVPPQLREMAARGILPGLGPAEVVTVLLALGHDESPTIRESAKATFRSLPDGVRQGALRADLQPAVVDALVELCQSDPEAIGALTRMLRIDESTIVRLADLASEELGEILATNEALLLRFPRAIERLYLNQRVRMSTAERLIGLALDNQVVLNLPAFEELAQAIRDQATKQEQARNSDGTYRTAEQLAAEAEELLRRGEELLHIDEEGKERISPRVKPLDMALKDLTIPQKIRRATLGTRAERMLLVREKHRGVAVAAASSPLLTDGEAAQIAASRNVIEDVLRTIARNKDLMRHYQVKLNLVQNPVTPFTFSARIISHLRFNDLRALTRSKNIPAAVKTAASQHLSKQKK